MKKGLDYNFKMDVVEGKSQAVILGGWDGTGYPATKEKFSLKSSGNAVSYGDLYALSFNSDGAASVLRTLAGGTRDGDAGVVLNRIQDVLFNQDSQSSLWGSLSVSRCGSGALSNGVIGLYVSGWLVGSYSTVIDFVTFVTKANAVNWGTFNDDGAEGLAPAGNRIRGIVYGGYTNSSARVSIIHAFNYASQGVSYNYGAPRFDVAQAAGASNVVRAIFAGGLVFSPWGHRSEIEYKDLASDGDAVNFGNLATANRQWRAGADNLHACFAGTIGGVNAKTIVQMAIASKSDGTDWGDTVATRTHPAMGSDSHGGLQ